MNKKRTCITPLVLLLFMLWPISAGATGRVVEINLDELKPDKNWDVAAVIKGVDADGRTVWQHTTNKYSMTELQLLQEIGRYDSMYFYNECGTVVALDVETGSVVWKNESFQGASISSFIDQDGTIFLCGYYGPDLCVISNNGSTIKRVQSFRDDLGWPFAIEKVSDTVIRITFGLTASGDEGYYYVDITHYSQADSIHPLVVGDLYDVSKEAWYADSVKWAIENQIANGTGAHSFSPNTDCTTAQILTFLWRADGSPEPIIQNPFENVNTNEFYYQAALWAFEKELVAGSSFESETPCTRADTVAYLWKLAGKPSIAGNSEFSDVPNGSAFERAIVWAVHNGITGGTGDNKFSPNQICSRAQIVTFLMRYSAYRDIPCVQSWRSAYEHLIFSKEYLNYGTKGDTQDYWHLPDTGGKDKNPITFSLHDMDANGVPELIIYNGGENEAVAGYHAFAFDGAKTVYLGVLGYRKGYFNIINNTDFPGLYYINGNNGTFLGTYYTLREGNLITEIVLTKNINSFDEYKSENITKNTTNNALFTACSNDIGEILPVFTAEEVDQMGWNSFCAVYGF